LLRSGPVRATYTEVKVLAVKIRLARAGAKKAPFYRVVAADSRAPRDGRFIEILGRYNPRTNPSTIEMDIEKIDAWIAKGAQPSETVAKLLAIAKNPEVAAPAKESGLSKKAQAKAEADAKAAAEAAEAAAKAAAEPAPEAVAEVEEPVEAEAPEAEEVVAEEPVAAEEAAEEVAADEAEEAAE
jgi:small subunit ribosomal protein S16